MKKTLILLIIIGICWFVGLMMQVIAMPYFYLDVILPPRVLEDTTPEERTEIVQRLRSISTPNFISWLGAISIIILSSCGFLIQRRSIGDARRDGIAEQISDGNAEKPPGVERTQ